MFTVDKASWHYRMAERHRTFNNQWDMPGDFCSYWRWVVFGVIEFTVFAFLACAFVTFNILGIVAAFAGVWNDFPLLAGMNAVTGAVAFTILIGLSLAYITRKVRDYKHNKQEYSEPSTSFIGTWYKTLNDKLCIRVQYK